MYVAKHDPRTRVAYWRFRGATRAADWMRHLADMDVVATWSPGSPRPCVLMEIDDFAPTAKQRAEIAAHSIARTYQPLIALVTTNGLLRGALRAIAWLQQGTKRYETELFADASSAIEWLEQRGERALPRLREWHAESDIGGTPRTTDD